MAKLTNIPERVCPDRYASGEEPRVGDVLLAKDGKERVVLSVSSQPFFSVRLRDPNPGGTSDYEALPLLYYVLVRRAQDWKSDADRTAIRDKIIKSATAALGAEPETLYPSSFADCDDLLSPFQSRLVSSWNGTPEKCPGCGLSYPLKPNEHSVNCQSEEHLAAFPWASDTPHQVTSSTPQVAASPQAPKPIIDWMFEPPKWFLPSPFTGGREEIVQCVPCSSDWRGGHLFDHANEKWTVLFRITLILREFDRIPEHSPAKSVFEAAFYYARAVAGAYGPILVGNDSAREFGLRFDREHQKDFARQIVKLSREKQREDHVIVEMIRKSIAGREDLVDAFLTGRLG